jgi:hypothetical protein
MNDTEVRVHKVESRGDLLPAYVLYTWPSMQLHEDATRHLSDIASQTSVAHQRNVAYSLSHWHSYCLAAGIDYKFATRDNLIGYKFAMTNSISAVSGERLSSGTIGQRILAVVSFYRYGAVRGWYSSGQPSQIEPQRANLKGHRRRKELAITPGTGHYDLRIAQELRATAIFCLRNRSSIGMIIFSEL